MDRAREQLLAGARGAGDQHRNIVFGRLPAERDGAAHRAFRQMDDAVELVLAPFLPPFVADRAPQPLARWLDLDGDRHRLALQSRKPRGLADGLEQRLRVPRLGDVTIDAGQIDARDHILGIGVAGNDDADRVGPALAHALQEVDAGLARHALVAEDDLHHLAFQHRLGLGRVMGFDHLELVAEHAPQRLERTGFVVDDEDGGVRAHARRSGEERTARTPPVTASQAKPSGPAASAGLESGPLVRRRRPAHCASHPGGIARLRSR